MRKGGITFFQIALKYFELNLEIVFRFFEIFSLILKVISKSQKMKVGMKDSIMLKKKKNKQGEEYSSKTLLNL